jgi:hypothetical protein
MTKSTLNVHAGHDDYHCVDDTGFFQLFAKNARRRPTSTSSPTASPSWR